jgi:cell division protein FtsZ
MSINLQMPDIRELKPHIIVFGVGGAGGNAVNNMITSGLLGCEFVVANTDAQALSSSKAKRVVQMGVEATQGLGAGSHPEVGRAAAEEAIDEIRDHLNGAHMAFITAGMGGGTGTGAAPVIARVTREMGILSVGVITKPFHFEGARRMQIAEAGIQELSKYVDTLLIIPNQNLFRVANEKTTFADAFSMADQVLYSGVACITDLMVKEGLINLDFADVRTVMREMGKAMMGTGEASGEKRALAAAEAAISNPLLDETTMRGARGLLISITGGKDLTLYEVDEAATRIREEVDSDANIILGATFDQSLDGLVRVSVVATGIEPPAAMAPAQPVAEVRQPVAEPHQQGMRAVEAALTAYDEPAPEIEAAPEMVDEVSIRRMPPRPSFFEPIVEERHEHYDEPAGPFIPPQAERPLRTARMPRIDELPLPGQNEVRASRGEMPAQATPEKKRMSLLQRLAHVGIGRSEQPEPEAEAPAPRLRPEPRSGAERRPPDAVSEYVRRPTARSLDLEQGRRAGDDDELDIPAFLRRQA